jgi:hypothetical protein
MPLSLDKFLCRFLLHILRKASCTILAQSPFIQVFTGNGINQVDRRVWLASLSQMRLCQDFSCGFRWRFCLH